MKDTLKVASIVVMGLLALGYAYQMPMFRPDVAPTPSYRMATVTPSNAIRHGHLNGHIDRILNEARAEALIARSA